MPHAPLTPHDDHVIAVTVGNLVHVVVVVGTVVVVVVAVVVVTGMVVVVLGGAVVVVGGRVVVVGGRVVVLGGAVVVVGGRVVVVGGRVVVVGGRVLVVVLRIVVRRGGALAGDVATDGLLSVARSALPGNDGRDGVLPNGGPVVAVVTTTFAVVVVLLVSLVGTVVVTLARWTKSVGGAVSDVAKAHTRTPVTASTATTSARLGRQTPSR